MELGRAHSQVVQLNLSCLGSFYFLNLCATKPQNKNFKILLQNVGNEICTELKNGNKIGKVTVKFDRSNAANIRRNSLVVEYNING